MPFPGESRQSESFGNTRPRNRNGVEEEDVTRIYENVNALWENAWYNHNNNRYPRELPPPPPPPPPPPLPPPSARDRNRNDRSKVKAIRNDTAVKSIVDLKDFKGNLDCQKCVQVDGAHWASSIHHSMQDVSTVVANSKPQHEYSQSMFNLKESTQSQNNQAANYIRSTQGYYPNQVQDQLNIKRKPLKIQPKNCNCQYWLDQEAEYHGQFKKFNRPPPIGALASNKLSNSRRPFLSSTSACNKKSQHDSEMNTLTYCMQDHLSFNDFYRDEKIGSTFNETKLFISNTKKCSCCGIELRCGDAMVIESMQLSYHIECFKCCVCYEHLGTDIQVRNKKLHCLNCFSGDDGVQYSCV